MRAILLMTVLLLGCEQFDLNEMLNQNEMLNPNEKVFPSQSSTWGKDSKQMHLSIRLSYKADGYCYYLIEAQSVYETLMQVLSGTSTQHLHITFVDKNTLILYELAPSWNITDRRDVAKNSVVWRGRWQIEKAMFNEIDHYELRFK